MGVATSSLALSSSPQDSPRPDARRKATGDARYSQDVYPAGLLHAVVVRSPYAAARIVSVDTTEAERMPGVAAVLGPDDVPGNLSGDVVHDEPILARGVVRYVGEPVALVAAETPGAARAAARRVTVDYEPLPAALTLAEALAADAPEVHSGESNLGEPSDVERGDVQRAFDEAELVVETSVETHRVHQGYIELRCAMAQIDPEGRLMVTTTAQAPFLVRRTLARLFGLPMTKVVVRVPAFGGGFGGKLHDGMAAFAAALALATRRPVQVVSTRAEEMQAANPRENSTVTLVSAIDRDGRILARKAVAHFDSGAYTCDTPYITSMGAMQACGPYAIDAVDAKVFPVRTNTQPTGSFRGPSGPQMCFANEAHMDDIADRVGVDRIEVRRRNIMRARATGPTGQAIDDPAMETCLERVVEVLEQWRRERPETSADAGRRRGFGIACAWWFTAPSFSAASVRLNEDATATIYTGATEIGTGAVAAGLTTLVADGLGLPASDVTLVSGDTEAAPADFGSDGSRTLYGAGNAVVEATGEVKGILAEAAADELEASPQDIVFERGRVHVAGSPEPSITLDEVVAAAAAKGGPVVGSGRFQSPSVPIADGCARNMPIPSFNESTFHCHGVEIEIDPELGTMEILRYAAAHDTGPVVVRGGVKGQIEGGIVQGIGYGLYEQLLFDDRGTTRNADLVDYRMPTIADVPGEILIIPVEEHRSAHGPQGAKGIGEAPVIPPAACLASAVRDALGVRVTELPLTADRVARLAASPGRALDPVS